jgi:hypothetical protein
MKGRIILAVLLLAGFGALRLPAELRLEVEQREAWFRGVDFNLELREQVGQLGFIAALGGFRSLLAAVLWIEGHTAWENLEWGRMAGLFNTVVTLQPRSMLYWDMAAWHMAWNASVAALNNPNQASEALRIRAQRQYFDLGRSFLERGIRSNPDRAMLYERLGVLLRDKFEDHCGAAEAFAKAAEFPEAMPYVARFAAYEAAKCPGREREAYERLRELYLESAANHLPTLLVLLAELEERLEIPLDQRLPDLPKPSDAGAEGASESSMP